MGTSLFLPLLIFLAGIGLLLYFSEKLVEATVGTSLEFGVSAFLISVIFIGFDPENLAVGAVASHEGVSGIALGSIIGAAMVAVALALGITALIAPMKFEPSSAKYHMLPLLAVLLPGLLGYDGLLSRADGAILLAGYFLSVMYLIWLHRRGYDIRTAGDTAEPETEAGKYGRWKALGLMVLSLAAIILGSELVVTGSETIISRFGLSDTLFGMTLLALIVSVEELARELPAAMRGRGDITYGNVLGSVLAFFLFNAGVIALVEPVPVGGDVRFFYYPISLVTVFFVTALIFFESIPRWAGAVLLLIYLSFFSWGYVV